MVADAGYWSYITADHLIWASSTKYAVQDFFFIKLAAANISHHTYRCITNTLRLLQQKP